MDVNFQNLEHNIPAGSILDLPEVIESGMSDALVFSSQSQWMTGLLSYCIVEANLRLVIWLQQNTNYLAAALAPMSLQFGNNPFVFEGSGQNSNMWKTSADRRWVTGNSNLILSNRDIVIRINFTCGPKSVIIIQAGSCKVKNIKNEDAFPLYKTSLSAIMDGKTIAGKSIDVISEYFLEDYGYILEFGKCQLL
ncbi:unnamed protein product [Allacma fusca]|uniref:Uncharacterized protein n=1 Tax=Allacma fusca TaxID=39272 RepID=A0A8J2PFF5_9HEXA|nr:unnamed protein product [Allacma fusca]